MQLSSFILITIFIWLGIQPASAQIEIKNPSFEISNSAGIPTDWTICNSGSTPDMLPGLWDVISEPSDGNTYLGLITRNDGTWESIGQRLTDKVIPSRCQRFNVDLARSPTYVGYSLPVKLRIYLGKNACDKAQLIGETENILSTEWTTIQINFIPDEAYSHIVLEAYYANGIYIYYNGNILVDNITPIEVCPRA
ncbi:MAG: hypothetical protein KJP00_06260 [Bacteroidia bacterium]|nr:hypothetical protein [Bacteroidia bacterium]